MSYSRGRVRTSKGKGARNAPIRRSSVTSAEEAGTLRRMLVEGEQRHSRQHRRKYGVIIAGIEVNHTRINCPKSRSAAM